MRGSYFIPVDRQHNDAIRVFLSDKNSHLFLERLLLGPEFDIRIHLIIPTLFAECVDDSWLSRVDIPPETADLDVITRQYQCSLECIRCARKIEPHPSDTHQIALRIVAGTRDSDQQWCYDFLMGLLCKRCRTVPQTFTCQIDSSYYPQIANVIAKYVLWTPLDVSNDGYYVATQYLNAFEMAASRYSPNIVRYVLGATRLEVCEYCKLATPLVNVCQRCQCIPFCTSPCRATVRCAHDNGVCVLIRKGRLFDVANAFYIDLNYKPQPCVRNGESVDD